MSEGRGASLSAPRHEDWRAAVFEPCLPEVADDPILG